MTTPMATPVATEGEVTTAGRFPLGTLNWGAIFGGAFTALGLWALLGAFGLAIGLSAVSPTDQGLGGVATWLGLWSLIIPILAMFAGVLLAARAANVVRPLAGMLHGVVVWGLTTFAGFLFLLMTATTAIGAAWTATTSAASLAGQTLSSVVSEVPGGRLAAGVGNFFGVDRSTLVSAINQQLPADRQVTAAQIQASLQDAVNTAILQGRMSREVFISALARNTRMNEAEAGRFATQLEEQWNQTTGAALSQVQAAADAARRGAMTVLDRVGKGFWWIFFSTLFGLGAAVAAGYLGARETRREGPRERVIAVRPTGPTAVPS
jgi:hypothetical protein